MAILVQQMMSLARQAGGSYKTVSDRIKLAQRFCKRLTVECNIQIRRVEQLKARHIIDYIEMRRALGLGKRSLQNEMAMIRVSLRQAGRVKLADGDRISNQTLGIGGASRNGTRRAIPDIHYQIVQEAAQQKDAGFALSIELARLMGLRSQEAVQCSQSLKTWQRALARGDTQLKVVFGTKGGRPRYTEVLDTGAVRHALEKAITVAESRHGRLIDKPDLKKAMKYWSNHVSKIGLKGVYSSHSLRYAWAQEDIAYYLAQGFSQQEALAQTAMDLGHGDGRGRYVAQVYGRKDDQ